MERMQLICLPWTYLCKETDGVFCSSESVGPARVNQHPPLDLSMQLNKLHSPVVVAARVA